MMWEKLKKVLWPTVQKLLSKFDQKNNSVDKKEGKESEVDKNKIQSVLSIALSAFFILFTSFVLAQVVSAFAVSSLLKPVLAPKKSKKEQNELALKSVKTPNYRELNKDILKRNIFNDEGKFPDES